MTCYVGIINLSSNKPTFMENKLTNFDYARLKILYEIVQKQSRLILKIYFLNSSNKRVIYNKHI